MRRIGLALATTAAALCAPGAGTCAAQIWPGLAAISPGQQCRAAIERAERSYQIPPHLLAAIGRVESGRRGPDGRVDPWPYSINVEGTDEVFETKAAAIAGVRLAQAGGARSIDIGCLQVNLMYHPDAFASLEDAFDPWRNADYAARFLVQLHGQTGSWAAATADYHSATPELGLPYAAKVQAAYGDEAALPAIPVALPVAAVGRPAAGFRGSLTNAGTAMPQARAFSQAIAATGRGLDAYRRDPTRLAPLMLRQ